ncbi:unnamed protein product [Adineta ricciae]|uniref:Uncharacterized protein n=2 Tax=Adineta ricciae TaxID=249248 RepID=A0A813UK30_ADIRI|nr:unnamed protein product [Adineta ricciae]
MANNPNQTKVLNEVLKMNDSFRTFNMYENIEPLSDEIKVFRCEEADETSSINSALSAISLRSISSNRCNENLSTNDDVQQRLKRIHKLAATRKENKDNEQDTIPTRLQQNNNHDDEEEDYDEEKGAQLLQEMIASVLKPKSRQKEAFIQNMNFKPDIVTSTTDKKYRVQQYDKSEKNTRI